MENMKKNENTTAIISVWLKGWNMDDKWEAVDKILKAYNELVRILIEEKKGWNMSVGSKPRCEKCPVRAFCRFSIFNCPLRKIVEGWNMPQTVKDAYDKMHEYFKRLKRYGQQKLEQYF